MTPITVRVGESEVSASVRGEGDTTVVLGHGAGSNRQTPLLLRVAARLADSGRVAILYNFPYSEARRRLPDPPAVLEATVAAVAAAARRQGPTRLVLGGKSMGGRIASQAVAKGLAAEALVFFGYPLHPPGKEDQLRDRHLAQVAAPMLFLQGTRDAFARWDLIEAVTARLGPRARLVRLEGADHGYRVPKSAADVEPLIVTELLAFLDARGL